MTDDDRSTPDEPRPPRPLRRRISGRVAALVAGCVALVVACACWATAAFTPDGVLEWIGLQRPGWTRMLVIGAWSVFLLSAWFTFAAVLGHTAHALDADRPPDEPALAAFAEWLGWCAAITAPSLLALLVLRKFTLDLLPL